MTDGPVGFKENNENDTAMDHDVRRSSDLCYLQFVDRKSVV